MRNIIVGIFVVLIASSVKAQVPMVATDITTAQVQAFIKDAPRDRNSDRPTRVIDAGGYRVGVFGVFRPKNTPPSVTVHQTNVPEVNYMLKGAGVLVTGGALRKTSDAAASDSRKLDGRRERRHSRRRPLANCQRSRTAVSAAKQASSRSISLPRCVL